MWPHTVQIQRTSSSLSLIFSTLRAPHRVHGGAVDCASVADMAGTHQQIADLC